MNENPTIRVEGDSAYEARTELIQRAKAEWTETERVILQRRSVRLYEKEQIPGFMVKRILEAGRFAPSAGNCQPWKFIVLRDQQIIDEMTQDIIQTAKRVRRLIDYRKPGRFWLQPFTKALIRLRPNDLHPIPYGALKLVGENRFDVWHGAPTIILIFKDVRGASCPDLDCGIAGQNMALAAHSMGLGTCWTGLAILAFQYSNKWKKRFTIEYPYKYIASLAIGWPKGEPDGMVERPVHSVEWYEKGRKTLHE